MNTKQLVDRIKANHHLGPEDAVGVVASFGKAALIEKDGRTISFVATTDDIDLQDEVVVPSGADTSYFDQNRKVFADHTYTIPNTIGVVRSMSPFIRADTHQAGWKVRAFMLPGNSLADAVLMMAEEDAIGWSIGFQALDYGPPSSKESDAFKSATKSPQSIVRRWKWLEVSATGLPCNCSCQSQKGADMSDRGKSILDALLVKGKITRHVAVAMGLPDTLLSKRRVAIV